MGKVTNIRLPNGFSISCESDDAGVTDITQNAGENVMEAQDDAQKPVDQDAAEYDAANEADTKSETEDVQKVASQESFINNMAKLNEKTFYGLAQYKRAQEGFGISDGFSGLKFKTAEEMFKDSKVLGAIDTAKKWANEKEYSLATIKEVKENKQTLGTFLFRRAGRNAAASNIERVFQKGKLRTVKGATLFTLETNVSMAAANMWLLVGIFSLTPALIRQFTGKTLLISFIFFKKKNGKVFAKGLCKATINKSYDVSNESASIFSSFLSREAAEAEEATSETAETSDTNTTVIDETPEETTDVDVKAEVETPEETTDVDVKAEAETPEETSEETEEKESSSENESDDEEKAIENFFANWGL